MEQARAKGSYIGSEFLSVHIGTGHHSAPYLHGLAPNHKGIMEPPALVTGRLDMPAKPGISQFTPSTVRNTAFACSGAASFSPRPYANVDVIYALTPSEGEANKL